MDSKDLKNLHRYLDQDSNQGTNPKNGKSPKNYATVMCGDVNSLKENAEAEDVDHIQTLDESRQVNMLGSYFPSVNKYITTELEICKLLSEKVFARLFNDWRGCRFEFVNVNGQRVPTMEFAFTEGGSNMYDYVKRGDNAIAAIERRNQVLGDYAYDQYITKANNRLSNRRRAYQLTHQAKDWLSKLMIENIDCVVKVDHKKEIKWKQPNWDKYNYEKADDNHAYPVFGGYRPDFNVVNLVVRNLDPDKVLDLFFNHSKDSEAADYIKALEEDDRKVARDLKCIRRISIDPNPRMTPNGVDRSVIIECMSKQDWNRINDMTGINREASNGSKFY